MIDCENIIRQQLQRGMTDKEINEFFEQAKRLKWQVQANNRINMSAQQVKQLAQQWGERQKLAALQHKINVQRQIKARAHLLGYCLTKAQGKEAEGLYGFLVGSKYNREGGRMSVDARQTQLRGYYACGFITDIEAISKAHLKILKSGKMDREICEAAWSANHPQAFTGPAEAMEIGQVIHKWSERARMDANAAGAWIPPLDGYIFRQTHDSAKLNAAGYNQWKADIEPKLDWQKINDGLFLDPANAKQKEAFLHGSWKALVDGVHLTHKPQPGQPQTGGNPFVSTSVMGSEAAHLSHERILHFKSGGDFYDYHVKYGRGNINQAIIDGLESSANATALMRAMGPSPHATLDWVHRNIVETLHRRGDLEGAKRARNMRNAIDDSMKELDGTLNIEGNPTAAAIGRNVRNVVSMSSLGGAVMSSISDMPNIASELAFQGINPFKGMAEEMRLFCQGYGSVESRRVAALCGTYFDGMIGNVVSRFSGEELPGKMTWAMNLFFKANGLTYWTDWHKRATCLVMAHHLGQLRNYHFNQLSKGQKRAFALYGIDEGRWELLRKGATTMADGREYLTPEAAMTLSDADLSAYLTRAGRRDTDAARQALKSELEEQLRTYYRDRVQYAVLEPDAKNRRWLRHGTAAGTWSGELWRFITQFKSFPTLFMQRPMQRAIYGQGGAEGITHLAVLMAAMTGMGYLAMTAKQLAAGKTPHDFFEHPYKTMLAAFAQGGGAGILGDLLFGTRNRMGGTLLATFAGPALGRLENLADIGFRLRDGDIDVGPAALRRLFQNIPGNNLFYINGVLHWYLLNHMYEAMRPGYIRRTMRTAEKENGQKFMFYPDRWK